MNKPTDPHAHWIQSADGLSSRNPAPDASPPRVPSHCVTVNVGTTHPQAPASPQPEAVRLALDRYGDLRVKIATAGAPPHSDYWHQALHEAEQAVAAAFQADIDEVMRLADEYAAWKAAHEEHATPGSLSHMNAAREALRSALAGEAKA